MACLDENTVAAFVAGALDEVSVAAFEAHVDQCARCFALVAASAKAMSMTEGSFASGSVVSAGEGAPGLEVLRRGTRVGRYEVTSLAGAGAMGRVYAAIDTELNRTIALKLVRAGRGADANRRLLREARTMAKIAADHGDDGTNDLLVSDVVRTNELQVWFLAEHIIDAPVVRAEGDREQ